MSLDPHVVRRDFPILERRFSGRPAVYFDNSCVTLRPQRVVDAVGDYYANYAGCHKRSPHRFGRETMEVFARARARIRRFIGASSVEEIVFVRNSTEGINLLAAVLPLKSGDSVLTCELEHNSNFLPWRELSSKKGVSHKNFALGEDLSFDETRFAAGLTGDVKLVGVAHRSHVTGCRSPVEEIVRRARVCGAWVMLDAAQSAGHERIDVVRLGVDFMVFSAHKMLGPSGFGVLYARKSILETLPPYLIGGETVLDVTAEGIVPSEPPGRFEAGLPDYAGAVGLAAAMDYLDGIGLAEIDEHVRVLNAAATRALARIRGVRILGPADAAGRGGTLNFYVEGVDSVTLAALLDRTANVMLRAGVHCAHPWFNATGTPPSLRASFYLYNTLDEVAAFAQTLERILRSFY